MNYDAAEIVAKLNRIAVALERHTDVMLEHSGLLQESIELGRANVAISRESVDTSKALLALRQAESSFTGLLAEIKGLLKREPS